MRSLVRSLVFISTFLFAAASAMADHMTGTYTGVDGAAGVVLTLKQSGRTVTGELSQSAQGTLNGQSDGGDNVSGSATINGAGQFRFEGRWTQQAFTLALIGSDGRVEFTFNRGGGGGGIGGGAGGGGQQPQPQPPAPPGQAAIEYFLVENGATVGPFTLDQIKQRLAQGSLNRDALIWKAGLSNWVQISTLPEFAQQTPPPPPPPPPPPGGGTKPTPPGGGAVPNPPAGSGPPVLISPGFPGRSNN